MDDYYKILQVERTASIDEIKKSYRKLVKRFHPDQNPNNKDAEKIFAKLSEAYDTLNNPEKKAAYDKKLFGNTEDFENKKEKKNTNTHKQGKKANVNFNGTESMFESFFGFNPNNSDKTVHFNDENIKPMKTKDAYEHIFGKRHF